MDRRGSSVLAWSVFGLTLIAVLIGLVFVVLDWGAPEPSGSFGPVGLALAVGMPMALVGGLVASRHPGNPIGWLLCGMGLTLCTAELPILYAVYALFVRGGSIPGGEVGAWVGNWTWIPMVILLGLAFLLFPDGRLLSARWRIVAGVLVASWLVLMLAAAFLAGPIDTFREVINPFGASWAKPLASIATPIAILALAASAGSLVPRYRRAATEERAQVRWVMAAGLFLGVAFLINVLLSPLGGVPPAHPSIVSLSEAVAILSFASVPLAVGVAILKYRLYDIDIVINKAMVFGILGSFITVVYVGIVMGVGALVGRSGNAVLSAVAASVVALAFQPVRRRAQHLANRVVYGKRATPYEVLSAFSERVAGSYRTDDMLPRMAAILGQGTRAKRAQVWLRIRGELQPSAVWPGDAERSRAVRTTNADLPSLPDVSHSVAVLDEGELLGALSLTKAPNDPVTPTEERLIKDLARQAGLVLRNAQLVEDLRASRQRLVRTQDEERRRLERDVHDGAQQQLVALAVKARLAGSMVGREEARARGLLEEIAHDSHDALESLRDLARGIYPPLLADQGLGPALEARTRKAIVPVQVTAGVGRYPQHVEATAYFCCLEAVQNAGKYAEASRVDIVLESTDGELRFEVRDDGRGFEPATVPRGSGLQNMLDRLEAVGGSLEIRSAPGAGTTLLGKIPIR